MDDASARGGSNATQLEPFRQDNLDWHRRAAPTKERATRLKEDDGRVRLMKRDYLDEDGQRPASLSNFPQGGFSAELPLFTAQDDAATRPAAAA